MRAKSNSQMVSPTVLLFSSPRFPNLTSPQIAHLYPNLSYTMKQSSDRIALKKNEVYTKALEGDPNLTFT
eukprot:1302301-Amorphochlora_amoeboformis.AAC.1